MTITRQNSEYLCIKYDSVLNFLEDGQLNALFDILG